MWKSMREWSAPEGPRNGTQMVVLLMDGTRMVAEYDGWCQRWKDHKGECIDWQNKPVAWVELPTVPKELLERKRAVADARKALETIERASL